MVNFMKKNLILSSALVLSLGLAGCQKLDLLEKSPKLTSKKPKEERAPLEEPIALVAPEAEPSPLPPMADYGLAMKQIMEFSEGQAGEYSVEAWVPFPGNAIVAVSGLPEGATFDPATMKIKWTPSRQAQRHYAIEIVVKSDRDEIAVYRRSAVLLVEDSRGALAVQTGSNRAEVVEGTALEQRLVIVDEDFPEGPFVLEVEGEPAGTSVIRLSSNEYALQYMPDFTVVKAADGQEKTYHLTVKATNPRGETVTTENLVWTVKDRLLAPSVSHPARVTMTNDATFQISAADLNEEAAPSIELENGSLTFVQGEPVMDGNVMTVTLRLTNVPEALVGTAQVMNFKACTSSRADHVECKSFSIPVSLEAQRWPEPLVNRSNWPEGNLRNETEGTRVITALFIIAGGPDETVPTVTATRSTHASDRVFMEGTTLVVLAGNPGFRMITLEVTSSLGIKRVESFALNVLARRK